MRVFRRFTLRAAFVLALALSIPRYSTAQNLLTGDELREAAVDAYVYAYPLVLMDVSRQVMTNVAESSPRTGTKAPVNQFVHLPAFPDASFTDVVRPNADTLYSSLWFDVAAEPIVVSVPDSGGRYYLLPMLDMWTDIFASPGKRTTGTEAQTFAIVGSDWKGTLPDGIVEVRSPTRYGWMIGRTQTNGVADYANVHRFQTGLKVTPLSAWGKDVAPRPHKVDATISDLPPVEQVAEMDAATFFERFSSAVAENPPHANDYPMLDRLARMGIERGKRFDLAEAPQDVREALIAAVPVAREKIKNYHADRVANGWIMVMSPVGTYGTDYLKRAAIAFAGLGANVVEDAIYPFALTTTDGKPFYSASAYSIHFTKEKLPPVRAFWSLTMYNDRQLFAANPINRYAIGDRDALKFADDGSLTLYIQRDSPGKDKESNWLPAPNEGGFTMNLRLYWPKAAALDGTWTPPPVERAE